MWPRSRAAAAHAERPATAMTHSTATPSAAFIASSAWPARSFLGSSRACSSRSCCTTVAPHRRRRAAVHACAPSEQNAARSEPPFEIRGFSLANLFLAAGAVVTVSSFWSYIGSYGTASATSLGFVYGVPILLIGCALKYAELQPVPVSSTPDARQARETRATAIQKKIYQDITRHRYGDEAHMAAALSSLGLVPRGEACPVLERAEEQVAEGGEYDLRLIFRSVATPYSDWQQRQQRFEKFFGPGVSAHVEKVDAKQRLVALTLRSRAQQ